MRCPCRSIALPTPPQGPLTAEELELLHAYWRAANYLSVGQIYLLDNQHAKWLKVTLDIPWRRPIASLNYLLSSHVWRQDHNGFSHQELREALASSLGEADAVGHRIVHGGTRFHQAAELTEALEHRSGMLGLSGSADMAEILERTRGGDERAELALGVYVHRLRGSIAAMAAALGGLDALVFTGGVGEHSPQIRAAAAAGLAFLGVAIDGHRNEAAHGDGEISAVGASVRTLMLAAREDLEIVRQVNSLLGA
ncbi:MAG TPA: hypothetical protein VGN25_04890 [Solirubrobacteraceae bacterium]|nr:hypothetical protein [Solirubrobacteraceae bacterium]